MSSFHSIPRFILVLVVATCRAEETRPSTPENFFHEVFHEQKALADPADQPPMPTYSNVVQEAPSQQSQVPRAAEVDLLSVPGKVAQPVQQPEEKSQPATQLSETRKLPGDRELFAEKQLALSPNVQPGLPYKEPALPIDGQVVRPRVEMGQQPLDQQNLAETRIAQTFNTQPLFQPLLQTADKGNRHQGIHVPDGQLRELLEKPDSLLSAEAVRSNGPGLAEALSKINDKDVQNVFESTVVASNLNQLKERQQYRGTTTAFGIVPTTTTVGGGSGGSGALAQQIVSAALSTTPAPVSIPAGKPPAIQEAKAEDALNKAVAAAMGQQG